MVAAKKEERTRFGPNKYAALHLLLGRWVRNHAQSGRHCYLTLGGTEFRDVRSIYFIDRELASPAVSFELKGQRLKLAVTYLAGRRHLPIVELKKAA